MVMVTARVEIAHVHATEATQDNIVKDALSLQ